MRLMGHGLSSGAEALLGALGEGASEHPAEELVGLVGELGRLADEGAQLAALEALMGAAPRGQRVRALSGERAQRAANEAFGEALGVLGVGELGHRPQVALAVARLLRRHPDLAGREFYQQVDAPSLERILGALREDDALPGALRLGAAALTWPLPMSLVLALCGVEPAGEPPPLDAVVAADLVGALVERRPGLGEQAQRAEEDLLLLERLWPRQREDARALALSHLRDRIEIERSHREGDMHRGSEAPALGALDGPQQARLCALLWASVGPESQQERALVCQLLLTAQLPLDPQQSLRLLASPNREARKVALAALWVSLDASCGDGLLALRARLIDAERVQVDAMLARLGRDPGEQIGHLGGLSVTDTQGAGGGLELAAAQGGDLSEIEEGDAQALMIVGKPWRGELTVKQRAWLSVAPPPRAMSYGLLARLLVLGTAHSRLWAMGIVVPLVMLGALLGGGIVLMVIAGGIIGGTLLLLLDVILWTSTLVQSLRRAPVMLMPVVQIHKTWRGAVVEVETDRGRRSLRMTAGEAGKFAPGELLPVMWSHRGALHSPMQIAGIDVRADGQLTVRRSHALLAWGVAAILVTSVLALLGVGLVEVLM